MKHCAWKDRGLFVIQTNWRTALHLKGTFLGCSTCPHGTYQPYRNNCRQCRRCTECTATQEIVRECDPEQDRQCAERADSPTTRQPMSDSTVSSMPWRDSSQSTPLADYTINDTMETHTPTKVQQEPSDANATDRDNDKSQTCKSDRGGDNTVVALCVAVAVLLVMVAVLLIALVFTCVKCRLQKKLICQLQDPNAELQRVTVMQDENGNPGIHGQGGQGTQLPGEPPPLDVQGNSNSEVRPTAHVNHVTGTVQYTAPPVHDLLQANAGRSTSVQPLNTRQCEPSLSGEKHGPLPKESGSSLEVSGPSPEEPSPSPKESGPDQQDSGQSPGPSQNESDPLPELPCPSLGESDPSQQEFGPSPKESELSSQEKFEDSSCSQSLVIKGCDKVKDGFLDAVAEEISHADVEKVCRALGMKQSKINNIKDRYRDRSDLGFQLLYAVSKKEGKKLTYQRLITTLRETKNTNAADELTKKFNIQS
ncbi:uncharacterized protein [Diadema antillarum]|uniref:uncharacterized protein isoform X1 n=1 Tax=Diadema antillarum TaxID=105358 RepID=UPI003A8ADDC1